VDPGDNGEDEEEVMLQMTQAIEARDALYDGGIVHNEPAEYGILKEVHVKNFMCHENFEFKLGPLINFIVGKNGSGKSAILTAIVLCLGGKASATNRGARLQNFIKEGEDHAQITCTIKNEGENAYLPDLYGAAIQVERHIQRGGTSSFKLKSETGKIVSTRKADLEEICDHMMLQIENPLAVLSQDQARQFLTGASAKDKYKFFMKGVQLEQLDQDYRIIEEQLDNISAKIEIRTPDLKVLKANMERATNQLELSNRYDGMRDRVREYRRQLLWVQVEAKEADRDRYAQEVQKADNKIAAFQAKAEEVDAVYQRSDEAATAAKAAFDTAQEEVARLKAEQADLEIALKEAKNVVHEATTEQRQIHGLLRAAQETIVSREQDVDKESRRLAELDGGGAARRIAALDAAKDAAVESRQRLEHHQRQREDRLEDVTRLDKLEKDTSAEKMKEEKRVAELETLIQTLKAKRDSQDSVYHNNMKFLLRAIQQETGFQERPVGPIGKHVKLLKLEWSAILESVFGRSLSGFVVTSKRDEKLLSALMEKTKCQGLPIFIANSTPLDIASHLPDPQFETILSVLDIDNELVTKQLVIANQIEQSILHPDLFEATQILRNGGQPLRNVKRCFCLGRRDNAKGFVLSLRNGTVAQDPAHGWTNSPRMQTDVGQNIRLQEQALGERKAQRLRADEEFRSAQDRLKKAKQALKAHDNETRVLQIALQQADTRVEELEDAIKDDNVESDKLERLREALQKAKDEKIVHENSYEDSVIDRDSKKTALDEARANKNAADKRVEEAEAVADAVKAKAQRASTKRAHDLKEKNEAMEKIKDAQVDRAAIEARMHEVEQEALSYAEQARNVSERVNIPDGETFESLQKKSDKLREELKKWAKQVGDRGDLAAAKKKCDEAFAQAKQEMERLESLQDQLRQTLNTRRERWERFRQMITARSRAGFGKMLSARGFRGQLHVDHMKKEMDIHVEPDITRRDGSGRGAKTLSGGEKSFSQICLLLSVWDAMGMPMRCLDEFDVYMDPVNRNTSVRLLIDGARHSPGGQFVLISPGVRSDIPRTEDVTTIE
jgi:structural maintenance of chromosomes protein 6